MTNKKMLQIKNIIKINACLLIILVIAALIRYWGISFGLPHTECRPDEAMIIHEAFHAPLIFFHPSSFHYPSLYKYIVLCLCAFYFIFGLIIGRYTSLIDFAQEYAINIQNFCLISRYFSAFLGIATILIVYKITKRLFDRKTAIISSFYLSLAYLHVRDSHFGCVDISQTFFIMGSILFILESYKVKTLKNYIISGIFAGLAASTKYVGILLIVPMVIVHGLNNLDKKDKRMQIFFDKRILFFIAALVFVFLLGTPFSIIDFPKFISDYLFEIRVLYGENLGAIFGRGWWHHLRFSLFFGLGWPLLFTSLAGILLLIKTDLKKTAMLCSFPLIYYFIIGKGYEINVRYAIPVIPFLCITGSFFTVYVSEKLTERIKPQLKNITIFLMTIFIMAPSAYNSIQFNRLLAKRDNRLIATEWVYNNIPVGSAICQIGTFGKLQLRPTLELLEKQYEEAVIGNGKGKIFRKLRVDYWKKENLAGYEEWIFDEKTEVFKVGKNEKNTFPKYIIVERSPLVLYSKVPHSIEKFLSVSYHLKKSFKVINIEERKNLFDQADAFYIPFVGFKDVQRPGPNIYIYEKR